MNGGSEQDALGRLGLRSLVDNEQNSARDVMGWIESEVWQVAWLLRFSAPRLSTSTYNASVTDPRLFQMEPAYTSTGDTSKDRLAFFHLIEQLKVRYISEFSSNLTILNIGDVFYADTETNWMAQWEGINLNMTTLPSNVIISLIPSVYKRFQMQKGM